MARNHKATGLAAFICFTIPARTQPDRIDGSSGTLQPSRKMHFIRSQSHIPPPSAKQKTEFAG